MKINLLALDIASITGYATKHTSGIWNLKPKSDESKGIRLLKFESKLKEACKLYNINLIAFERPAGRHKKSIIVESELIGVMKKFCEDKLTSGGIQYTAYSATEIKKFATDNGNCSKELMIKAAQDKLGYKGNDDNEADALWLYQIAKKEFSIE